jgi:membrane-associated phospholipid phosphatase
MPAPQPFPLPRPARDRLATDARQALLAFGLYEWATLGYLALSLIFLFTFRENLPAWWKHALLRPAIVLAMLGLVAAERRFNLPSVRFARHWYPFALFIFFFEELHHISRLIVPRWLDTWFLGFDYALLGVHPTLWFQQFASPALTDTMQFFYLTYYFYTVVLCGLLYARREISAFWTVMNATALAYILGYLIALLVPAEGPYHTLAALHVVPLDGPFFTRMVNTVQHFGRVHGAAFPSLHVAGAFVAVLGAWRFSRRMFWWFLPLFFGMMVSTVYGRYHYAVDILGGLLIGALGWKLTRAFSANPSAMR